MEHLNQSYSSPDEPNVCEPKLCAQPVEELLPPSASPDEFNAHESLMDEQPVDDTYAPIHNNHPMLRGGKLELESLRCIMLECQVLKKILHLFTRLLRDLSERLLLILSFKL